MSVPTTLADKWAHTVEQRPDEPFLIFESSTGEITQWSYREFDGLVLRVAGALLAADVAPGRSVHVALTNSPAFIALWLATVRLGGVFVPCDPHARSQEIAEQLQRTRPAVGVASVHRAEVYRQAAAENAVSLFTVDEDDTELAVFHGPAARSEDLPHPDPLSAAAIMFTSGTTSRPKGVVITQANYAFAGETMANAAGLCADSRQLVVLPLFHANAQYYSFAPAIVTGASVALMSRFSASRILEQAATHAATHASLFAAPMRMILARGAQPRSDLRLKHVWYAQNVTAAQYEELSRLFGCRPRQLYGMTETIAAVLTTPAEEANGNPAMGRQTPGCEVGLGETDADGVAELLVGGRRGIELFREYHDQPDVTVQSFTPDNWFRTGDLARRDASGMYYFAGRRSDVLKVAGENVSLAEVEAAIAEHPGVFEVAVVGRPDPVRDELPIAYVVPRASTTSVTIEDVEKWCADRLSPAKRPREIIFVDELPRTSVGKIRKFLLR